MWGGKRKVALFVFTLSLFLRSPFLVSIPFFFFAGDFGIQHSTYVSSLCCVFSEGSRLSRKERGRERRERGRETSEGARTEAGSDAASTGRAKASRSAAAGEATIVSPFPPSRGASSSLAGPHSPLSRVAHRPPASPRAREKRQMRRRTREARGERREIIAGQRQAKRVGRFLRRKQRDASALSISSLCPFVPSLFAPLSSSEWT